MGLRDRCLRSPPNPCRAMNERVQHTHRHHTQRTVSSQLSSTVALAPLRGVPFSPPRAPDNTYLYLHRRRRVVFLRVHTYTYTRSNIHPIQLLEDIAYTVNTRNKPSLLLRVHFSSPCRAFSASSARIIPVQLHRERQREQVYAHQGSGGVYCKIQCNFKMAATRRLQKVIANYMYFPARLERLLLIMIQLIQRAKILSLSSLRLAAVLYSRPLQHGRTGRARGSSSRKRRIPIYPRDGAMPPKAGFVYPFFGTSGGPSARKSLSFGFLLISLQELGDLRASAMKNFTNIQVDESNILTWQGLILPVSASSSGATTRG